MRSCSSLLLLRRRDRDQLDLGELMLADHAAGIAARRAGFGAEARRAGGVARTAAVFVDDGFAHQIGQRHFGGGDEPRCLLSKNSLLSASLGDSSAQFPRECGPDDRQWEAPN